MDPIAGGAAQGEVRLKFKWILVGFTAGVDLELGAEGVEGDGCRTEIGDPALSLSVRVGAKTDDDPAVGRHAFINPRAGAARRPLLLLRYI
jgi:hypothetical protein